MTLPPMTETEEQYHHIIDKAAAVYALVKHFCPDNGYRKLALDRLDEALTNVKRSFEEKPDGG